MRVTNTARKTRFGRRWHGFSGLHRVLCGLLASLQLLLPTLVAALPTDGKVVGGSATIQQSNSKTLNIQQATDKAILNWHSFSIAADEAVHFVQPSVTSIALNRVVGTDPSVILGRLQSNGRIFLLNPNGILFGAGAQVNVGGLLATTLQIHDDDFMAGRFLFAQDPLKGLHSVINRGSIQVSEHGYVFLVAPGVSNEGMIVANLGKVVLGSGEKLTVDLMGDGLINYTLSGKVLAQVTDHEGQPVASAVSNSGTIQADGGHVILQAKAAGDIFSSVVNQSGVIRAQSLVDHGGVVRLEGSDPVANTGAIGWQANLGQVQNADGAVHNTGTIDVSAAEPGAAQGQVTITGQRVGISGSILARGADGAQGGQVLISSTDSTVVTSESVIDTSGVGHSSAGNVVVWSDKNTLFGGTILARGGAFGGNGGQIEVSGHENLGFVGQVNALAPMGMVGSLLLDPRNITVATGGGATLAQVDQFSDTPGADQTIAPATINAAAANVTLQANNDITVTNAIGMTNAGVGITMQAGRDINVNAAITTNNGNISLTANDAAAIAANRLAGTGDIVFGAGANLNAGTGSINLSIGPSAVAPFNPGSITTVRNLTTTTGNISINSRNTVSLSGAVNAGSGTVSINANSDGAGAQNFTMNAGSSITTTNATANAVQIVVNSPASGTGAASLQGSISTGSGGGVTVSTRGQAAVGGNITGGAITQGAVLTMNTGAAGTIALATGNSAASSITLNTIGNDFVGAVGVSRAFNVALRDANALVLGASTISGTLGVTTAGAITQTGPLTVTGTTTLAAGALNNITLTNASNNFSTVAITNGNSVALTDSNALILGASTVSGTLNVNTSGALTQSGVLNVTGTTTLAAGAANNINLATSANNFSTVSVTSGNTVSLRDTNALVLGASTVSNNLALTTGGALSQTGALAVNGTTSFTATAANTDILLGTQANNFGGALSFAGTLANFRDVSIRNVNAGATVPAMGGLTALRNLTLTHDNAGVTLPALTLTAGGNLTVTAGGAITDTGILVVPGTTTLTAGVANNITLDNANNFTGAVSVVSGNNVTLNDTNALVLGASTINGTLNVTANGALTQTGALNVTGATTLASGALNNITLNNAANNFSTVAVTSGNNVALTDVNALDLAASTVSGTLGVTTNGALTQSGALTVTGATTLAAGAANDITLTNAANNFSSVGMTSGNNVGLTDSNALVLNASTISGNLNVTTNGALTQSGALTVTGATTLAAGAANNITLTNAANNFTGAVSVVSGNNVALTDTNALVLGASTVSGTLGLTTGGSLSQTGALAVTGGTTFTATAANTDILLDTQANNFGGALSFAGTQANFRDVQLRNVNAGATVPALAGLTNLRNLTLTFDNAPITLPALTLTAGGNLNVTAGGAITQTGAITVPGTTTLATTVAGSDILLNTQANNLTGAVSFGGTLANIRDVGLRNVNAGATVPALAGSTNLRNLTLQFDNAAIALPALTASGNVNLTAGGSITQTGAATVGGTTTLATTLAGSDLLFNTQANNLTGAVTIGGVQTNVRDFGLRNVNAGATIPALAGLTNLRDLTLTFDNAAMTLPTLTVSGNLAATAGGLISQSGALSVAGSASFNTTGAATLGSVTVANGGALTLNTSTVGGNLTANTTAGDITLPAGQTLTVVGDATFTPTGTTNLLGTTRIGGTQSSIGGTGSVFTLGADTNLNALPLPGTGNITVNTTGTTATFASGPILPTAINLNNAGNNFGGPVSVTTAAPGFTGSTANTYNLTQTAAVTLGAGRSLTVTDLGGTAGKRGNITLLTGTNSFDTVNFTGGNIAWAETGPVTIAGVSANAGTTSTGTLAITATGAITQTGAITAPGTTTLTAGANDITLTNAGNNFGTVSVASGNNVALTDLNALDLGASTIGGTLNMTTAGAITQSGALTVTGTTTLAAGAANDITLTNAANNFSTVGITNANNVALTDANALDLGISTVSGTMTVTTGGALTQTGAVTVAGLTTLAAGAANDITLTNAGNDFSTVAVTSGNNVSLRDSTALVLGASTISGNLALTTGGTLTQTGALNVTGTTSFTATAANTDLLLATQANNFGGTLSFLGTQANFRDVQLRNTNAGATVPALAGLTNLRDLTLTFDNAPIALPALTASGNVNLTAGGSITQTGAATVGGATTLATTVAGSDLLLDQANNLSGAVLFGGTLTNIRDVNVRNVNAGATIPSLAGLTNLRNLTLTFDNTPIALPAVTASGNLNLTAGGAVTQTGAATIGGATTLATTLAGSDLLFNTQANNLTGAVTIGGTQANVRDLGLRNVNAAATVPTLAGLTNLRNLTLQFDNAAMTLPTLTASGNLLATSGGLLSQSGALSVAGSATFNTTAAPTLGSVALTNGGALTLNTSTVGGNLTATTTAGDITLPVGQTLTVVGNATLDPAGNLNLLGTTRIGGTQSSTGGGGSTFTLGTDTNLNALSLPATGNITVNTTGNTATFAGGPILPTAINLNHAGNNFGGPVSVTTAAPAFTGTTTNTYNLTQSAPVTLNVGQSLTVTDLGGTAGQRGNITLTNVANSFETVTFTGGNIAWAETGPVTIGGVSANAGTTSTGTLAVTSTGAITQTGSITAQGATTLTAGANNITLTNAGNNFSTVSVVSGNDVALNDVDALVLGASTVNGGLNVTTNGAITQSGAITVAGTTTLAGGAANNITLTDAGNNFSTVSITSGNNVALIDANALNLAASTVSGTLNLTTNGALTQSGAVTVTGTTTFAAGAANDITLTNAANNFGTVGVTSSNNVSLTDANALNLAASTISGALNVTTGGALTQSGALNVTGSTTLAAGANDITLTNAGNNFNTVGITSGNNVALIDANALNLAASTVGGNLNVTTSGALTQSGAVTVAAATTLAAGANDITLTNGGNNFNSVGVTSGNNVSLTDANALTLNASNVTGTFSANAADLTVGGAIASTGGAVNLTATNSVTQLANLSAAGANNVTVTATGGAITMAAGATSGSGTIAYTSGTDTTLGSLSTGGAVNVIANGGSVLSATGSGTNVTAGANSSLQAFNGVVGTQANPMTVNVNPGTLSIRATAAIGGISAFLTGTVLPSNALTLLNVPPGLVCFNGCPVTPSTNPLGGFFGVIPSFNKESVIPSYLPESSAPPLISVVSTYLPGTVVAEAPADVKADDQSVARDIPPCFPVAACKPGATLLTSPADGSDPEITGR